MKARALLVVGSLGIPLSLGCSAGSAEPVASWDEASCSAVWTGDLSYGGSALKVRGCASSGHCSEPVTVPRLCAVDAAGHMDPDAFCTADSGNADPHAEVRAVASVWSLDGAAQPAMLRLNVFVDYPLELARSLTDDDRSTLLVEGDGNTVLVDATSTVPYATGVWGNPNDPCKGILVNLSGGPTSE